MFLHSPERSQHSAKAAGMNKRGSHQRIGKGQLTDSWTDNEEKCWFDKPVISSFPGYTELFADDSLIYTSILTVAVFSYPKQSD